MNGETPESQMIAAILTVLILVVDLAIRIVLLFYIPRNRKPTAALAWLFAIALIPIGATILFFVIGKTSLSKRRRDMQQYIDGLYHRYNRNLKRSHLTAKIDEPFKSTAKLAESLSSLAPTSHNEVDIIHGYDNIIRDMTGAVTKARSYIYVEFFAMALDATTEPFFNALDRAIKRGVTVHVLFDTLGSRKYPRYKEMKKRLTEMGAEWHSMLPIRFTYHQYNRPDLRNHRKILVIDNTDAYLGSLNMIDKTYHRKDDIYYVELVCHLEGPSVNESAAVFASDWYAETGEMLHHFMENTIRTSRGTAKVQVLPSGPGYPYRNNLKTFVSLINEARKSVLITNPYLVPDESLLAAITAASLRGVKVSILNSESMDQWMVGHAQRSYYEQLLKAGVEIYLYRKPELMHSKYMVIDKIAAVIGSSNFDIRSFELNLESSVLAYDTRVARALYNRHITDRHNAKQVHLASWKKRSRFSELLDSVARLTSALQ